MTVLRDMAVAIAIGLLIALYFVTYDEAGRLTRLERDVVCLKHPTHATSSVGPVGINGVRASIPTPTLVVCP